MFAYFSVLEVTVTDDSWVASYVADANRLVHKHGGQYLARTSNHQVLEGDRENPALRIVIGWPSKQAALDFMSDPEYVPHLRARTAGSVSHHALIEAKDDLA
ncbi:DUF1330 domain-containing protein [Vibrio sp. LaRot3]|uniref:DUF1330 domain-containing protein n=1 Tax=Vibrio sp. LaRot3 TaxID=2998829 RepID=UPI0022CDCC8D|nr:DUF1330 domain-containing protein [Vibrio sp. LaRot3]MDA0148236.1 DUF1330 domain-containing protein [Vibrio sp. LaRot3]